MSRIGRIVASVICIGIFHLTAGASHGMAAPDLSWDDLRLFKVGVGVTDQWYVGDTPVFQAPGTNIGTSTAPFGFNWETRLYDPNGVLVDRDGPFGGQQAMAAGETRIFFHNLGYVLPSPGTWTAEVVFGNVAGDVNPENDVMRKTFTVLSGPGEDNDGDGSPAEIDCNDNDSSIYPGAFESCDGKDNNCDGLVPDTEVDADADGYMLCAGDCNDANPAVNPAAFEIPGNLADENCDGYLGQCDPTAYWRSHGQFVQCVAHETHALISQGLISEAGGKAIVSSAAQSGVGK